MECGKNEHGYYIGGEGTSSANGGKNDATEKNFLHNRGEKGNAQDHEACVIVEELVDQFLIHIGVLFLEEGTNGG